MKAPADLLTVLEAAGLPRESLALMQEPVTLQRLATFFEMRARWASTHNLSGPRALHDPWGADLIDGLAAARVSPAERPLIDVGAGSGIPGLVVACVQPSRAVVLVEPIAKRTAFLRSVCARLPLESVRVVRARWPADVPGVGPAEADVISRAVVDPGEWPTLAARGGPLVGGVLRMLAARRPPCDLNGFELTAALDYSVEGHGERRIERWTRLPD